MDHILSIAFPTFHLNKWRFDDAFILSNSAVKSHFSHYLTITTFFSELLNIRTTIAGFRAIKTCYSLQDQYVLRFYCACELLFDNNNGFLFCRHFVVQGVYYYFYQIFRNNAEATATELKKKGIGDGSVGMLSSLLVAALSG